VSSEALAKEDTLRRDVAEDLRGATAGKPWGSTKSQDFYVPRTILLEYEGRQRLFWVRPYGTAMRRSIGRGIFYVWIMIFETVRVVACM